MKNKYIVEPYREKNFTAGAKAKDDITYFLNKNGFKKIQAKIPQNKLLKFLNSSYVWRNALRQTKVKDIVVYQYPTLSRIFGDYFIKIANQKKLTKVIILHDIDSLRGFRDGISDKKKEIKFINQFDYVIAHNNKMKTWLVNEGVTKKIVSLEIFDYRVENKEIDFDKVYTDDSIIFAGNLIKSPFLQNLNIKSKIKLFGINPFKNYPNNIDYQGSFTSEQLEIKMTGKYGLVWDGPSINSCVGPTGEYTKYNNPHKTSLYLSLGIPVIMWKKAALSEFITANNVGIVIDDLEKLDKRLSDVSEEAYLEMKKNAFELSKKLRQGYFIDKAIATINNYEQH